jgi:biotin operon repressor
MLDDENDIYQIVNKITGEVMPISLFVEVAKADSWQKAFAKTLGEYIGITGGASNKILAYIIAKKDNKNMIHGTMEEIANNIGVSKAAVNKVFQTLQSHDYLKKVRNGSYMLSPKVMRTGRHMMGAALLRIWGLEE